MKYLFFDLETTGVKFWRHGIHQLAGIVEIDGEVKEEFDFKIRPYEKAIIEQDALDIGGVTKQQILNYMPCRQGKIEFTKMLSKYVDRFDPKDKFFLVGYNNAGFDDKFLRVFFELNEDKYFGSWFWAGTLDVMVLASNYLKEERHLMQDFKLGTVAKHLGLDFDPEQAHDGIYDVKATRQIYQIIQLV